MADEDDRKQGELALSFGPVRQAPGSRTLAKSLPAISRAHLKLVEASAEIRANPTEYELAFIAKHFIQATLPHSNPGDALPAWKRTNGNLSLTVRPGWDSSRDCSYGYPYGTIPRLLLFWMTTEALRTKSPRLELGSSLYGFMEELGLNPDNGSSGAKRSDARRLRGQMERLFHATISFNIDLQKGDVQGKAWLDMQVAPEGMLWWSARDPNQAALWGSWVELGTKFYQAIISSPVPVDMRALKELKNSALALDLYAWATYTAFQAQKSGAARFVAWRWLHEQIGADYASIKKFKQKTITALRSVQAVYPALELKQVRGGLRILPTSAPAVGQLPHAGS